VRDLNTAISTIPSNLVAGPMGYHELEFFEAAAGGARAAEGHVLTIRRALLLLALANSAGAQGRSIRIRDFDALVYVHSDGSLDVTEQLTVGFTGQWNGIVRDLSLHHNTAQGRATKLDVTVGYITDAAGERLRVEEESKDNGWTRGLRIWIPGASDADRQIIIRYRVANAIRFFYASSKEGCARRAVLERHRQQLDDADRQSARARRPPRRRHAPRAPRSTPGRVDRSPRTRQSRSTAT